MGMAEKANFLNKAEAQLRTFLTAEKMDMTLRAMADALEEFEMLQLPIHAPERDDLLKIYLDALRIQGRSPKTIALYKRIIERLMNDIGGVPTRQITVYHLRNWLATEKTRGVQDSTLENNRQIFSAYFNWLQRENLIDRNPAGNLGTIKKQKKQKKIYSAVEIEKLHNACVQLRNRAILHFLQSTGCRISEMTDLNRNSVDLQRGECTVLGKGNKERVVFLDPVTCMLISDYLAQREDDDPALFIGKRNERLRPNGVREMLNTLARKAGVEHVHPHKFRRTLATNLIRRGMQIQEVASMLGHEKLDTTMEYVVINHDDLKHDHRRYYE